MSKVTLVLVVCLCFLSCEDIIEVIDISSETVEVLAPTNNAIVNSSPNISFNWEAVEDAEAYRIQIATPTFQDATQIVIDSTLTTTIFKDSLSANSYQWRVRAENSGYETAYTTQSFTVE